MSVISGHGRNYIYEKVVVVRATVRRVDGTVKYILNNLNRNYSYKM